MEHLAAGSKIFNKKGLARKGTAPFILKIASDESDLESPDSSFFRNKGID